MAFFINENIHHEISRVLKNTSTASSFQLKIGEIFSPFLLMKWLHYARFHVFPDMDLDEAEELMLNYKSTV